MKSISSETTFETNVAASRELEQDPVASVRTCLRACESRWLGGRTVVLKLKTAKFRIVTRSQSLDAPTQLADRIFRIARAAPEERGGRHRVSPAGRRHPSTCIPPPNAIRSDWWTAVRASAPRPSAPWTGCVRANSARRRSAKGVGWATVAVARCRSQRH